MRLRFLTGYSGWMIKCRAAFARAILRARTTAPLACAPCGCPGYLASRERERHGDSGIAEAESAPRPVMTAAAETATACHDHAHCSRGGGHDDGRLHRRTRRPDRAASAEVFRRAPLRPVAHLLATQRGTFWHERLVEDRCREWHVVRLRREGGRWRSRSRQARVDVHGHSRGLRMARARGPVGEQAQGQI